MSKAKLKIKKGDQVVVTSGANKGAKGEVTEVYRDAERVTIQGVNTRTRHVKPTQTNPGGRETFDAPIHISNVALADPKTGKPTRVGYKVLKDGTKVRVAKASGETIEGK